MPVCLTISPSSVFNTGCFVFFTSIISSFSHILKNAFFTSPKTPRFPLVL